MDGLKAYFYVAYVIFSMKYSRSTLKIFCICLIVTFLQHMWIEKNCWGSYFSSHSKKFCQDFLSSTLNPAACSSNIVIMMKSNLLLEQSIRFWAIVVKIVFIFVINEPMGFHPKLVNHSKKLFLKKVPVVTKYQT